MTLSGLGMLLIALGGLMLVVIGIAHVGLRACRADWGSRWCNCLDGLVRIFCRRFHGLHGDAIALPEHGGALLVANHVSGLDPLLLVAATRRPLRFMIAVEEYERFGLNWLFRAIGCIPVDRSGRPEQSFRAAVRALKTGEVVALFPHGKIHLDSEPHHSIKPGVQKLALLANVPIYPARLTGIAGAGRVIGAVYRRSRAAVTAYTPYQPEATRDPQFRDRLGALLLGREPVSTVDTQGESASHP